MALSEAALVATPEAREVQEAAGTRPDCPRCEPSTCIAEGVTDMEYGAPGSFRWMRCQRCHLVRLDPEPSDEVLAAAYPATYHGYVEPKSAITRFLRDRSIKGLAAQLCAGLPDGGRVLDVGCARGDLLAAMGEEKRLELFGVEYSKEIADAARARGITIYQGDLSMVDLSPGTIDLVLMQHVLEHVLDPFDTLARVAELLKPGGRLVGELPNLASWDARLFGKYWGGGHAPRHIFHFTPQTLEASLRSRGFEDIVISPALHTGHWALSIQNWLRRGRTDTKGLVSGRTSYYPLFLLATIPINLLQMIGVRTGIMRFEARAPQK